ncbi:hypothetical protein M5689_002365 [Euphorbia peplus]|nr:hypothetical protein M5689_002365 [Euphorbia peplus]
MSSGTTAKVRLVRCPKCRRILPEMPNIPVYQCGGCFTTLQAKSRAQTTSSLPETRAEETNILDRVSEDKESSSSSHEASLHCADECPSNQNCGTDQIQYRNIGGDNVKGKNIVSDDESNMSDQNGSEDKFGGEKLDYNRSIDSQKSGTDVSKAEETDTELVIGANLSNEASSNGSHQNDCLPKELDFLEKGELLQPASVRTHLKVKDNDESLSFAAKVKAEKEIDKRSNNGELVDTKGSTSTITTCSPTGESVSSDVSTSSDEQLKQSQKTVDSAREQLEQTPETAFHGLDRLRSTATRYASSNEQLEQPQETAPDGLYRLRSTDTFYASPDEQLEETSLHGLDRLRSIDTFYASPNEQLDQPLETDRHGLDRVRSTDTFDPTSSVNPSSDLTATLVHLLKSPTTRSSRAYYDDGVSSYEEADDQLHNRHNYGSKHAYKVANHVGSDVRSRRDRVPVSSNYGMQQHFRNSAAIPPERTHYPLKYSKLDQDELLESERLSHPGRNRKNFERDEYLPHHSFYRRESRATSNQLPNELYYSSNYASPDRPANLDQEKQKLLRMVYELQDQLNKASLNDTATGGVSWKDHQIPMYYNHEVEPEQSFHNLVPPRYSGPVREGSSWSQQRKYSHIPFSAEATIGRHQPDHSLCCCPQERKWSAQLPPSGPGYKKGHCRIHSRPNLYSSYGSCPSSPQRHVDPPFSMYSNSRGAQSDDQRHIDYGVRGYMKEENHLPKRHLRPLAGGAPIITCPCCLKQLQLPADFLLFKRRCHRLKCGACSEVLKFSLVNNTHLMPYMPVSEAPPPSEVDEHSDAIHKRNFTSAPHVDYPSISCSDDCGQPFCKSCSRGNAVERKTAYGSLQHEKERKRSYLNERPSKGKNPVIEYDSAGPSTSTSRSKIKSSEIEELQEEALRDESSPLHRLMGYSSAREVIYS